MSAEATLDAALTLLLAKATTPGADPTTRTAVMKYGFTGGGTAIDPTLMDPIDLDVPFPCRIVWARLKAGDGLGAPVPVTATVELRLSQFETFGGSVPLYGDGTMPTLTAAPSVDCDLTGWQINLTDLDTITARIVTFTGSASWLSLQLKIRATEFQLGITDVLDGSSIVYTDAAGNPYVYRS